MFFTSKPLSPQGRHVLITGASSGPAGKPRCTWPNRVSR